MNSKDIRDGLLFVLPLVILVTVFVLLPVLGTIWNSFFRDIAFLERRFLGLGNFAALLSDRGFLQALRFTLFFVAVSVPLELMLGMAFALLLSQEMPLRGLWRACVLIPWAIPAAISARTFELIYNFQYGMANLILGDLGIAPVNWLGTNWGAFSALIIADAWKTAPFVAIILMAGLAAIPDELHRQAKVDGAGLFQRFGKITLPLLKPVIVVVLLFRTMDALRIFDLNYVLTGGGPGGATMSFSLYGYKYFLAGDFGYGSAVSVSLFLLSLGFALIYARVGGFRGELQ